MQPIGLFYDWIDERILNTSSGGDLMDDKGIVRLYFDRNERAIDETSKKYGKYCFSIANNILSNREDAEESVNDTYLDAWNSIPPHRPNSLSLFLGKITRRISIDLYRRKNAQKRGSYDGRQPRGATPCPRSGAVTESTRLRWHGCAKT